MLKPQYLTPETIHMICKKDLRVQLNDTEEPGRLVGKSPLHGGVRNT